MDEPFIVTSFPTNASAVLVNPRVSAVSYSSTKSDRRLCVVAAGVGCSVYDLADQTPLSSLTLGPTFSPTTPMIARSTPTSSTESVRIKGIRRTFVGVEAGATGQIWSWTEEERKDGSTEGEAQKSIHSFESPIIAIAAPRTLPSHLLVLSSTGSLAVTTDTDLSTVASLPSSTASPSIQQTLQVHPITSTSALTSFLPAPLLSLLPANHRAQLVFVMRFSGHTPASPSMVEIGRKKFKKTKRPSSAAIIDAADEEGDTAAKAELEVILVDTEVLNDGISCVGIVSLGRVAVAGSQVVVSDAGFVTALDSNGSLSSFRLAFPAFSAFPSTYADLFAEATTSIALTLTHIKTLPLSHTTLSPTSATTVALLPLHSSFILLASVRPRHSSVLTPEDPPTKVIALVWDVRLGAVVAESKISVPSAALPTPETATSRNVRVALNAISSQHVGLVVSPTSGTTGRSVIFVIPLSLPTQSVLAVVVGKQALTRKYLVAGDGITAQAKKSEPLRHPRTSASKLVLLEASEAARATFLAQVESTLSVSDASKVTEGMEGAVAKVDDLFELFLSGERTRWGEYGVRKIKVAEEKEKKRRAAALDEKNALETGTKKYRSTKLKIEAAIAMGAEAGLSWIDVTAKRITNVSDVYRFKYFEVRKAVEDSVGSAVVESKKRAISNPESPIPSTFVTAVLRLFFPGYLSSGNDVRHAPSSKIWKHPTRTLAYLLDQKLVGDSMIEGGVTRFLARAGDWPNLVKALATMQDIPESTTVSLLKSVIAHSTSVASLDAIETDSLPFSPPALSTFLATFVDSPNTPSSLRNALQLQLSALEALPVLKILDGWLAWWAARGGGGGQESGRDGQRMKRLPVNPFYALTMADAEAAKEVEEFIPPSVEAILPLVQALLDAHFVTLLLQRQSHSLLKNLSNHITTHLAQADALALLLGPLAIYAKAKAEARLAADHVSAGVLSRTTMATKTQATKGSNGRQPKPSAIPVERKFGERMEKRVAAQEKHANVGDYVVDRFYL